MISPQSALQRLNPPPDQIIAVEDAPHDVTTAQDAGLRCVAIPHPHIDPARLPAAELVLTSATEMTLDQVLNAVRSSL